MNSFRKITADFVFTRYFYRIPIAKTVSFKSRSHYERYLTFVCYIGDRISTRINKFPIFVLYYVITVQIRPMTVNRTDLPCLYFSYRLKVHHQGTQRCDFIALAAILDTPLCDTHARTHTQKRRNEVVFYTALHHRLKKLT